MTDNRDRRRGARVRLAGLVATPATIILDPKRPGIPCTVVDISPTGASLDVADPERLPERFSLLNGKTARSCLVMWRRQHRIGVQF
ncbi:MAG TPA: PilZ domain-containing protein [Xanthobacteraceae bacterium]|nr:PilZ domain-containing protein [Xanthobacteraceae bacterium]